MLEFDFNRLMFSYGISGQSTYVLDSWLHPLKVSMPEEYDSNIEQNNLADYDDAGDDEESSEDVGEDDD